MLGGIDIRLALTYIFKDERWVRKVLIGALLALGPILIIGIFFILGYVTEILRRVMAGSEEPLPEWSGNFGTYLKQGIPVAIGMLIWYVPVAIFWSGTGLALRPQEAASQLGFGLSMMVIVNLYAAVIFPSVIGRYAATTRFGSMFEFGSIFASIRRIGVGFVTVWIAQIVVLLLTAVTIWTFVGMFLTIAYAAMVFGHIYGQAARIGYGEKPDTTEIPSATEGAVL